MLKTQAGRRRSKPARARRTALVVAAAVGITGLSAQAAFAFNPPINGPSGTSAHIRGTYGGLGNFAPLREGNSSYGYQHILQGGSTKNTANHEVTAFAQQQWNYAIGGGTSVEGNFAGSRLYVSVYNTSSGATRTMCVVVDNNDLKYANTLYGQKGIITAYWVAGSVNPNIVGDIKNKCAKD
jgi:hypothetical protein